MKIAWTVVSVDNEQRTAVVEYAMDKHRLSLNVPIDGKPEQSILRAVPVAYFMRLMPDDLPPLDELVGLSGAAEIKTESELQEAAGAGATVVS